MLAPGYRCDGFGGPKITMRHISIGARHWLDHIEIWFTLGIVALVAALSLAFDLPINLPSGGGARVQLHALSDFDPDGDGQEHPETVPAATDGDASTYWTTETYSSFDKPGVGIVLDAESGVELVALTLTTDTPGFTAVIQGSNSPDGGFKTISDSQTVAEQTTFDLRGGTFRYYLIWITSLESRAHINEVRARS